MDNRTKTHLPLTTAEAACIAPWHKSVPVSSRDGVIGFFVVDAADYEAVTAHSWHLNKSGGRPYLQSGWIGEDGERTSATVHRYILGLVANDGKEVDHIDGNQFHNWRGNLRICDHSVNMHNRAAFRTSKSGIKGVCWMPKQRLWCAYLNVAGKRLHTSYHKEQAPAALARLAAEVTHGVRSLQPATTHAEGLAS